MNQEQRRRLRAVLRGGASAEALLQAFAAIRELSDADLLAALQSSPPTPKAPDLTGEIRAMLEPILANAHEKAEALRRAAASDTVTIRGRGLTATVRALESHLGADAVRRAAQAVVDEARRLNGRPDPIP